MRKLLPYARENSSGIYVELGSSHIEVLSVDPSETLDQLVNAITTNTTLNGYVTAKVVNGYGGTW